MIPRDCTLLLPTRGFDDFPKNLPADQADDLLAAWLCMWHPHLIVALQAAPRCISATQIPVDLASTIALLPLCSRDLVGSELAQRYTDVGGALLETRGIWQARQQSLLGLLDQDPTAQPKAVSDNWAAEFAALGFAFLQIQLLTRQMRYTSNLDLLMFDSQLSQSAAALLQGNEEDAERMLQSCFDQLGQERDHYYSMDVSLLDLTLLAPSTLGPAITEQLNQSHPTTFIACADLLRSLKQKHPAVDEQLRTAAAEKKVSIAGGLETERPHPLMNADAIRNDLLRGRRAYETLGYNPPRTFTRYAFGQISDMPMHLRRSGYEGALLVAWEAGSYPSGSHAKFSWESTEGTYLSTLAPPLIDAADPVGYLTLGTRLGEALDHQHVPAFAFVHWPNRVSPYFELVKRTLARTPALGRWTTVDDFFEKTDQPYHQEQLAASQFSWDWMSDVASPYAPKKYFASALIPAAVAFHKNAVQLQSLKNILNLAFQLERFHDKPPVPSAEEEVESNGHAVPHAADLETLSQDLQQLIDRNDGLFDKPQELGANSAFIRAGLETLHMQVVERFARACGVKPKTDSPNALLINPSSAAQRISLTTGNGLVPEGEAKWSYACGAAGADERITMSDVPSLGMVRAKFSKGSAPNRKRERTLAETPGILMNDFLEAQIDAKSGALRSLHVPGRRGNRFSFQLAMRRRDPQGQAEYSQMRSESMQVIATSSVLGYLRVNGRMWLDDKPVARYEIDYRTYRGSRILDVTARLSEMTPTEVSPWNTGFVIRTAWPTEAAILTARGAGSRHVWSRGKTVAPLLIEIDEADYKTQFLCGGSAFHQRVDHRFMETLLAAPGSATCEARFGIGVDLPTPLQSARAFLDRTYSIQAELVGAAPEAAWLMHIDAKHVALDLEVPLVDSSGKCRGIRVLLSETANRSAACKLRCLREVAEAHRVDYIGNRMSQFSSEGDSVSITLRPNESMLVDVLWR
ncbi:MAG: hypothetical protein U0892_09625 [Pirellulales bacterium]